MSGSFVDFQELKRSVSIEQALPMLDLRLVRKGDQWRGPCPICGGGDRSLVVTVSKQAWYCFGCRKGGDVIALAAHIRDCSVKAAAIALAEQSGSVSVTGTRPRDTVPKALAAKETKKLQPLAYLQADHASVAAIGLEPETAAVFEAGYAPRGILRGRLAIPIHDREGALVAYCGRTVKDDSPSLIFPKGFDPAEYIFNAHRIGDGELYLVRDPLQVLVAHQSGIENVVSYLTDTISAQQLEMLAVLMDERQCDSVELT